MVDKANLPSTRELIDAHLKEGRIVIFFPWNRNLR
jgi:hypothetical protein